MLRSRLFYCMTAWYCSRMPTIQLTKILNSHLKIWIVTLRYQKRYTSMYKLALSWKKHALLSGLGGCTPTPCNAISDKRRCDFKISHREIVKFLSHFVHFLSIKNMLYCKESVSRTECWPCSIMSLFYLAGYTLLINVVIDNGCLSMFCSLEAANCTM
jgi:hypothetical protein